MNVLEFSKQKDGTGIGDRRRTKQHDSRSSCLIQMWYQTPGEAADQHLRWMFQSR